MRGRTVYRSDSNSGVAAVAAYPSLRAEDLVNAWAYARAHAVEIEAQTRENEAA
jgi:uncharacterized protein (DUF433 family)